MPRERIDHHLSQRLAERTRALNSAAIVADSEFVLYWMRTAMRGRENPALDVALSLGNQLGLPVLVYQALSERYRYASDRHHTFILEGARDVATQLAERGVAAVFHCERPRQRGPHLLSLGSRAAAVVTEDMPVAPLRLWTRRLADQLSRPVWAVDTACVVPMRLVGKGITRAFAYRDRIRPLIDDRIAAWDDVASEIPPAYPALPFAPIDWGNTEIAELVAACDIDHTIGPVVHTAGGSAAGYARWDSFRSQRLKAYARTRNDPNRDGVSRLSPYLHYGMVAPTRVAREAAAQDSPGTEKFIDELIVWRELAYTFCLYAHAHETLDALPEWARQTLLDHADDAREHIYDRETLERGKTGDALWDTAQASLRIHGELHNNVRMTWGKALLEWTQSPQAALDAIIDLNHRYALDGRDPASYGGILWCLGQFDRPFSPERPILGTVRQRPLAQHSARLDLPTWSARVHRPLVTPPPRVAVIGGGPAGALCARTLADHQVPVVVFDKGRRPGGRLSTRAAEDLRFDHGAQYFTARDRHLARRIQAWCQAGILAQWTGPFADIGPEGTTLRQLDEPRYVGVPGMAALVAHLLAEVDARFSTRVTGLRRAGNQIEIETVLADQDQRVVCEHFDYAVVAVPAPQAVPLLELAPTLRAPMAKVEIAPCWAVMATFDQAVDVPWAGARVRDSALPLSWLARNQTKPGRPEGEQWVLHGAPAWSRMHLEDDPESVASALTQAARALVGAPTMPAPRTARAHRWRYALVETPVGQPYLYHDRIGVCGDGLAGGRVESALVSGAALAGRLLGALGRS